MGNDNYKQQGQFLALILRHKPESVGVAMDEHGWVGIAELIDGMNAAGTYIDLLSRIVETDNKNRYSFSDDGRFIRANQGHSVHVDLELLPVEPPEFLYHGTATRFLDSIFVDGLLPMSRMHVHLSSDEETASLVGQRHGKLAILRVEAHRMFDDGYSFYVSNNGVWLTDVVSPEYFKQIR